MYKDKPTCQQTNRGSVAWVPLSKRNTLFFQWDSNSSTCCEFIYPFPYSQCGVSMADFRMLQMPCSTHPCDGEEAGGEDQPSEHLNMHEKATYRLHEKSQKTLESDFRAVSSPNCEGQMGEGFYAETRLSMHKRTCSSSGKVQQCSSPKV